MRAPTHCQSAQPGLGQSLKVDWRSPRRAHFVGIAGSGMRSLAAVLLGWGWYVSGSDTAPESVRFLAARGAKIHAGHASHYLPSGSDVLIYSDAVPESNPERRRAAELGIPTQSYFQVLGRLMSGTRGIAVAGTHGKSTVTAMLADLLVQAGLDPAVVFGATPIGQACGGKPGKGQVTLVEACEYRSNFLHLRPTHAIILNIEPDHFDCFASFAQLRQAFARFAASVPQHGLLIVPDYLSLEWLGESGVSCGVESFGLGPQAHWSARDLVADQGRFRFIISRAGKRLCQVRLQVPGRHNVLNALAAASLAWHQGVSPEQIASGLSKFSGLHRRLENVGTRGQVIFVDDYAHHPTEVTAGLLTLRAMFPGRRLWCVFQPHQASRTQHLLDEFAQSLQNADRVAVAEVFRAREAPRRPGEVTAADLAQRARKAGAWVAPVHTPDRIVRLLEADLAPGDVLVTMGAGDIGKICHAFVDRLREDRAAG